MNDSQSDLSVAPEPRSSGVAQFLYRWRWPLTGLALIFVVVSFAAGVMRVAEFSEDVAGLADTSNGNGAVKPLAFDPTMDVWFGEQDSAVQTYYQIEDTFVAEDFVMVTYEIEEGEFGVFGRDSLATIARLTERFLTIPGVRHVRSLTYNPWIRWGAIEDDSGVEEGLIITDLVDVDPMTLSDEDIVERMIATLGAKRTADRLGDDRVRAILGDSARYEDYIGEPLLLDTLVNERGTATAIQVQVLRPHIEDKVIEDLFEDESVRQIAPSLSSIEQQRAALRGIEHFLRLEKGTAIPTEERGELSAWVDSLEEGEKKNQWRVTLADPTKNFIEDQRGQLIRKYFEYDEVDGGFEDRTEPSEVITAPIGFQPKPLSDFEFAVAGVPTFERNFEEVGLADSKYVPLMFLVITVVLFVVFRRISSVLIPLAVVFGSIMAMVGSAFAQGDLLNNLTMMSPNMLTAVGIADAIHLVAAWVILRHSFETREELIIEVVRRNAVPVLLTSLTTAIGFYSLTASSIEPVKMLGAMAALGTFFAWGLSMTLVPALLSLIPHRKKNETQTAARVMLSPGFVRAFVEWIIRRRVSILVLSTLVFLVALFGMSRVTIDSDFRAMFPDDNPTMSNLIWIEARMGGTGDLEIVFSGLEGENANEPSLEDEARRSELRQRTLGATQYPEEFASLSEPEKLELQKLETAYQSWNASRIGVATKFLEPLDRFEERLREEMVEPDSVLSVVSDLISPLDILRKVHQVQNKNAAAFYRVPGESDVQEGSREDSLEFDEWTEEWSLTPAQSGSTLVAQYYLQYESGARPGESLTTQLSADRTRFRIQGRLKQASSIAHLNAFDRIEEIAVNEFPELAGSLKGSAGADDVSDMAISGKMLLFARTSDLFSHGFMKSMAIALTIITLLIGLIFRSVRFAVVSLVPNLLPILIPLSVFGLLNTPLDGPAILVSSVALGVCVDDTIHFFTKFVRSRRKGLDAKEALIQALTEAGTAMSVTTVVLIIGFSTLLLSDFAPNFQMGALAAMMIGLAWVADFVVTAAILSYEGFFGKSSPAKVS